MPTENTDNAEVLKLHPNDVVVLFHPGAAGEVELRNQRDRMMSALKGVAARSSVKIVSVLEYPRVEVRTHGDGEA